jgi:hypothetical protein
MGLEQFPVTMQEAQRYQDGEAGTSRMKKNNVIWMGVMKNLGQFVKTSVV